MNSKNSDDKNIEKLQVLWEEYKYRHELCWKIILQTTVALVVVSVVPYVQVEVVRGLGSLIITMPLLVLLTIVFAFFVVLNELEFLEKVREKYRELQSAMFHIDHREKYQKIRKDVYEKINQEEPENKNDEQYQKIEGEIFEKIKKKDGLRFRWLVYFYFSGLLVIGVCNALSVLLRWIPYIERTSEKVK